MRRRIQRPPPYEKPKQHPHPHLPANFVHFWQFQGHFWLLYPIFHCFPPLSRPFSPLSAAARYFHPTMAHQRPHRPFPQSRNSPPPFCFRRESGVPNVRESPCSSVFVRVAVPATHDPKKHQKPPVSRPFLPIFTPFPPQIARFRPISHPWCVSTLQKKRRHGVTVSRRHPLPPFPALRQQSPVDVASRPSRQQHHIFHPNPPTPQKIAQLHAQNVA